MKAPGFFPPTPVLCVTNLSKSLEHYEQVLGFDISWKWSETSEFDEEAAPTFACVTRGECCIFLCDNGQGQPGAWLCMNVCTLEELELVHREYQDKGADIVEAPVDYPWGMREMLVKDPDGNMFRVGCSLPESH